MHHIINPNRKHSQNFSQKNLLLGQLMHKRTTRRTQFLLNATQATTAWPIWTDSEPKETQVRKYVPDSDIVYKPEEWPFQLTVKIMPVNPFAFSIKLTIFEISFRTTPCNFNSCKELYIISDRIGSFICRQLGCHCYQWNSAHYWQTVVELVEMLLVASNDCQPRVTTHEDTR